MYLKRSKDCIDIIILKNEIHCVIAETILEFCHGIFINITSKIRLKLIGLIL